MKKVLFYALIALTLFAITSCNKDDDVTTFIVSFDTEGGSEVSPQKVEKYKKAIKPDDPIKENCIFQGWYNDDYEYDFSAPVASNITLKARFLFVNGFFVSETKQVCFATGNLQYHCKNKEWRFAPKQYDYIGYDNVNISDDYDGYIDLFGCGTGDNPTLVSQTNRDYVPFSEWGSKIDDANIWRTLTKDEWYYLIYYRDNASEKYGVAEVAGISGLILLPDAWKLPSGISFNAGVTSKEAVEHFKSKNNYSADEWHIMESLGAVFLPAAGSRLETLVDGFDYYGTYWSSSANDEGNAPGLDFRWYEVTLHNLSGCYGHSVRLVRDL